MATANAPSSASTGQGLHGQRPRPDEDQRRKGQAQNLDGPGTAHLWRAGLEGGGHRTGSAHRRYLQLLDGTLDSGSRCSRGRAGSAGAGAGAVEDGSSGSRASSMSGAIPRWLMDTPEGV